MNNVSYKIDETRLSMKDELLIKEMDKDKLSSLRYKTNRGYLDFIKRDTYSHFITVTFQYDHAFNQKINYLNKLIHFVNRELYGKKCYERGEYLKGLLFAEKHASGEYHFHLLISNDSKVTECKKDIGDMIYKSVPRVRSKKGRDGYRIFGRDSMDIKAVYDNKGVVKYASKGVWSSNGTSVFPLSKDGVINTGLDS